MKLPPLTVIPAGAGSGKTHALQDRIGEWVTHGLVAPERIVAVTFTEAAASELRERIGTRLLQLGRADDALRLDQAYISTIHAFGLRLLTEFAFDAGSSPRPRLLDEDEQGALIRLAADRSEAVSHIASNLERLGYRYDFVTERSAEDCFRDELLDVVDRLRSLGWSGHSDRWADEAEREVRKTYGPTADGAALTAALRAAVDALLREFPESLADLYPDNESAAKDLRRDYANLKRAAGGKPLETDWPLWQGLAGLRQSKRGSKLPERYDELAGRVVEAASMLSQHPGPLGQAVEHLRALLRAAQDVLVEYASDKRAAGLVDYADMIALARSLLRDQPSVREALTQRIDAVVVDEFQDTNPLQFALLWEIVAAGVPAVVVGDLKQAIMGFQGADPRLFEALLAQHAGACEPLTRNWRSQPALMAFINAVGPGLFPGGQYQSLDPAASRGTLEPLAVVRFPKRPKSDAAAVQAHAVGERIRRLLAEAPKVRDRKSGTMRPLRGGDVALLAPTNAMLADCARALRALGLRVRLQADGWYDSRAVSIARAALVYVTNPADRHAALFLAATELGVQSLQDSLGQLIEGHRVGDPLLDRLDALAGRVDGLDVAAVVGETIATLGLHDVVSSWPDGEQERANLLRLEAEAAAFLGANRRALSAGGFHGSGVQTFLAWLAACVERREGDRQSEPRVLDEDAIELVTWHASKGREWPVVAVCGLQREIDATLPDVGVDYPSFEPLGEVLAAARIVYSPTFASKETRARFTARLLPGALESARRLLYVALTRARETLLLEWPEYLDCKKSPTYWCVLAAECGVTLGEAELRVQGQAFACSITEGSALPPEPRADEAPSQPLPITGRRAIRREVPAAALTPDLRSPSGLEPAETAIEGLVTERYGDPLVLDLALGALERGAFLHRCFEVLGVRPGAKAGLGRITGVAIDGASLDAVAAGVARFEEWLSHRFAPVAVRREWPMLAALPDGSILSGTADVVVETAEGVWILDHKSDDVEDPVAAFAKYAPQLGAYATALSAEGRVVLGIGIHWIRRGEVTVGLGPSG
jgi:ATP-dependent helicase/nuclease subunit A